MLLKRLTVAAVAAIAVLSASAREHAPYQGERIMWDINSKKQLFDGGNYARIIPLADGRLMCAAESGGGISVTYSSDAGSTWTSPQRIVQNAAGVPYAVPDLVQLTDGTILVGFNPRPSQPFSEDRRFGIRTMRSTDNGQTWTGPIYISDASHKWDDGCWEPSFIEMPDGEVHCYFANEHPYTSSNEQEISLCRSFDKGLTWSAPERVSFSAGSRDGMPSTIITDAGELVTIYEDNQTGHFVATTGRCTVEQNWKDCWVSRNSSRRNTIFANSNECQYSSAAPYLRKLASGNTVASWQGDRHKKGCGESSFDMFVAVGDKDARNFKAITQPFCVGDDMHALWNSVAVGHGGAVYALASIGGVNVGNSIYMMKGYPMTDLRANFGTPELDASFAGEDWTGPKAAQVYLGVGSRNRSTHDFLYDDECLYFFSYVNDKNIFTDKIDNDGVYFYIDVNGTCDIYPQAGAYRIFFNADGTMEYSVGGNNRFTVAEIPEGLKFEKRVSRNYYMFEAAIPWSALGLDGAPAGRTMRANVVVRDRRDGALVLETLPEAISNQSWTWPEFRLSGGAGVAAPATEPEGTSFEINGRTVSTSGGASVEMMQAYTAAGALVASAAGNSITVPAAGMYIVRALNSCGPASSKIIIVE